MSLERSHTFTLGMPHLVPEQLSEVELYKILGDLQWQNIAAALGCRTSELVNDAGERLYASFVGIEMDLGEGCLADYREGDELQVHGTLRFYAKQFAEGRFTLETKGEKPRGGAGARVSMTNAMVARVAGNRRLKVFRPAGALERELPEMEDRPEALVEHERVQRSGEIEGIAFQGEPLRVVPAREGPVRYAVCPESDLNGAGLLYFARYLAIMNYAERVFLQEHLRQPISRDWIRCLAAEHRRTCYFANASEDDEVLVYPTVSLLVPEAPRPAAGSPFVTPMKLRIRHDLYRASDGELMASSVVRKALRIPTRAKGLQAEAERLVRDPERWGIEATRAGSS